MSHPVNFLAFIYFFFLWIYMKKKKLKVSFLNSSEVYLEMREKSLFFSPKGEEAPVLHNPSVSPNVSAV